MSTADERLRQVLLELPRTRLTPDDWSTVATHLDDVERGSGDVDALANVLFEANVRSRFRGTRSSAGVVPTKQTSVLPVVGLVCGGLLVGVGALLGGGVILAGIVVLGVFVFGIAFAGSRVAHRGGGAGEVDEGPEPVPMPGAVASTVDRLRARSSP